MSAAPAILGPDGRPWRKPAAPRRRFVRASYDSAKSTENNRRHWVAADSLSAAAANTLDVRKKLRERARYEFANNGYLHGLIVTLANDLIGTGPRLQLLTDDAEYNRAVEARFSEWAEADGLAEKLHTMAQAKKRDGEPFALLTTDEDLAPVTLSVRPIECDLVTDPFGTWPTDPTYSDGVRYSASGKPVSYTILNEHPGDTLRAFPAEFRVWPARLVIHWFRADRPGQLRGVPEVTPSLELYAMMRRYMLAVLTAAETAADFAALLETEAPGLGDEDHPDPFETLEIERGMMTTLPGGAKLSQLKAEQPTTTYAEYINMLLRQSGRAVNAPFNVTSGDSSPYNFSGARLDHLFYQSSLRVERDHCRRNVLERVVSGWLDEAVMIPGYLPPAPAGVPPTAPPHTWHWPGFHTIQPREEAAAATENLANRTTTLSKLLAERGLDWEDVLHQAARERDLMEELGLTPAAVPGRPATEPEPEDADAGR